MADEPGGQHSADSANLGHAIAWLRTTHEGTLSGKHVETLIAEIERLRVDVKERAPIRLGREIHDVINALADTCQRAYETFVLQEDMIQRLIEQQGGAS